MFRPSIGEIIVVILVIALLFGARRLPELGKSLGQAIRNFQRSFKGSDSDQTPRE